jgi:class 3 adenylate cyclase
VAQILARPRGARRCNIFVVAGNPRTCPNETDFVAGADVVEPRLGSLFVRTWPFARLHGAHIGPSAGRLGDPARFGAKPALRSAEELIGLLGEYQSRLVPVIERHGGSIDKYLGDGILASFGAILQNTTYAADLCRAIDELADTAAAWQRERAARGLPAPAVGMAGAVGEIVFGAVGPPTRLEYTVIGEVVNLVAKLEKQTKTEAVRALTTADTYALALEQGLRPARRVESRARRTIEGVGDPVDVVVLA